MTDFPRRFVAFPLAAIVAAMISVSAWAGAYEDILVAARNGDTGKVVELLQKGMDVNTSDPNGDTLTLIAARSGNRDLLETLLTNRANILKQNRYGDSPLMVATMQGHVEVVKRLLDGGAVIDNKGWNALHYAAYGGRTEIARMLIERQPDLDVRAPNGQTALMLASATGHTEMVKLLVESDADMDLEDPEGNTALTLAEKYAHPDVADYLRSEGAIE